jgi:hypothetical protein
VISLYTTSDCFRISFIHSLTPYLLTKDWIFINIDVPISANLVLPLARERLYLSSDQGVRKSELLLNFPDWNYSNIIDDSPWWYTPDQNKDNLYNGKFDPLLGL